MELRRPAAASTYVTFPMVSLGGVSLSGLTVTGTWIAWSDTSGGATSGGATALGNAFRNLSGGFPEISATGVYGGFLATTELPTASPYVMLRFTATNAATQYLYINTASQYANVVGIQGTAVATPVTAGYMPTDIKQTLNLSSPADNSVEKSLARVYFASQYLNVAVSTRSAPGTAQTVGALSAGAITSATFAAGAIDNTAIASNAIGANEFAADAVQAIVDGVLDESILSAHGTDNTVGKTLRRLYHATDYLDAPVSSAATPPSAATIADAVWDEVVYSGHPTDNTAGKVMQRLYHATDYLVASVLSGSRYADDFLGRTLTRGESGGRTVGQALMAQRNRVSISAGTLTVYSTDDTTAEWTATVATEAVSAIVTDINPA